ncbi:helix-turn-helix transcriptional regulator [Bacillus mycoides]|uniref:helix-turn-helix domain-containing protein n=1 Tax=Bacillus mycoides TaxID=1405 RepID=UPI002E251FC6|nr:helix-turn-helix transcriptional regulator [Bacillus mycoides]
MRRWADVKEGIQSISETKKFELETAAYLVEKVKNVREDLGWTQRDLAEKTGLKQPAIARIESGHTIPRLDTIAKMAKAMGYKITLSSEENSNF